VSISNLTLSGPFAVSSCADQIFGVLVLGGSVALTSDQVELVRPTDASLNGCQFGVGIQVGRKYWPLADFSDFLVEDFAGAATISNTSVSGYSKNGITVDGPGSSASIRGNTITGDGRVPYTAENGIQISRGAGGDVRENTVSGNAYTGDQIASSGGILLYEGCGDELVQSVQVMKNVLTNNDVGIFLNNFDDACDGPSSAMTNNKDTNNTITNDAVRISARVVSLRARDSSLNRSVWTSSEITTRPSTTTSPGSVTSTLPTTLRPGSTSCPSIPYRFQRPLQRSTPTARSSRFTVERREERSYCCCPGGFRGSVRRFNNHHSADGYLSPVCQHYVGDLGINHHILDLPSRKQLSHEAHHYFIVGARENVKALKCQRLRT